MIKISKIKTNPNNPRIIKDDQFYKLVQSIEKFPKMMALRPIVVDDNWIIVGGNMRHKALLELKYKEIPNDWVKQAKDFTEEELQEFVVKDNLNYGEWDWDMIANQFDTQMLDDWGMELPKFAIEDEVKTSDYVANRELDTMLDTYNNASIKQIVLYYDLEEYEHCLKGLDKIGKSFGLEDNSSVVKYLIDKLLEDDNSDTES